MRITCPVCAAQYELPPALAMRLPAQTRCAQCGHEWRAEPEPSERAPERAPIAPEPERAPQPQPEPATPNLTARPAASAQPDLGDPPDSRDQPAARTRPPHPKPPAHPLARVTPRDMWIASLLVLALLIALFLGFHHAISTAWPPSLRLYRALGL